MPGFNAATFLVKQALSKAAGTRWMSKIIANPNAEALAGQLGLGERLKRAISKQHLPLENVLMPSAATEKFIPRSLWSLDTYKGTAPFRELEPEVMEELKAHLSKRNIAGLNVAQILGSGLESGAAKIAPSRTTKYLTGQSGQPVAFKLGLTPPTGKLPQGLETPYWAHEQITPSVGPWWDAYKPRPIHTWFEPVMRPGSAIDVHPELERRLAENKALMSGMHVEDLDMSRDSFPNASQLGRYTLHDPANRYALDRSGVMDRGIFSAGAGVAHPHEEILRKMRDEWDRIQQLRFPDRSEEIRKMRERLVNPGTSQSQSDKRFTGGFVPEF